MSRPRSASRLLALGVMPWLLGACSLAGPTATPTRPEPPSVPSAPPPGRDGPAAAGEPEATTRPETGEASAAHRVVEIALAAIGTPYVWGGTDANGFDCSGLIQYAYGRLGIRLPRRSAAQAGAGRAIEPLPGALRPGDVLAFADGPGGRTSHVGLYVGDGAFIHSSSRGVRTSELGIRYWRDRLVAARRIVD